MNDYIETLLSQADHFLAQPEQSGEELRGIALKLLQINTNSFSRANRERINSTVVALAPFILGPEDIGILQQLERSQTKLKQDLSGASTRAARLEPTQNLRRLEEQQMLFLRGVLKNDQKKHDKSKLERKRYIKVMRALGIGTQENTSHAELLTDR